LHPTRLIGVGASVPDTVLTNDDLARLVDTNDEWITSRTGIRRRHVLAAGETMTAHAARAAQRALAMAQCDPADVDLVVLCTSTPDDAFGGAGQLQAAIGAHSAVAFDLTGACSGFVLGMVTAAQYLRTGLATRAVVVGGDALSRITDWTDRGTCILFGDGCGAVVMASADAVPEAYAASESGRAGAAKAAAAAAKAAAAAAAAAAAGAGAGSAAPVPAGVRGRGPPGCAILGVDMKSDGRGHKSLNCVYAPPLAGEGSADASAADAAAAAAAPLSKPQAPAPQAGSNAQYRNIAMAGQEVFKFAVRSVPAVIDSALDAAGVPKEDVDWLVMHQANARILDAAAQRLGLPAERVVTNLAEYGNTSAASIPLALDEAVRGGKVKPGDVMAMAGFGAGLTWAGAIVRWG
jgi:3-oxoacyl-[acyl-carrier-protein] synthase-3